MNVGLEGKNVALVSRDSWRKLAAIFGESRHSKCSEFMGVAGRVGLVVVEMSC